jgi:hypothetical protein
LKVFRQVLQKPGYHYICQGMRMGPVAALLSYQVIPRASESERQATVEGVAPEGDR